MDGILAIDTATRTASVGLADGERMIAERTLPKEQRHAAGLLPAVHDLLADAGWRSGDVGAVFFSRGPGSFTGLRVAATVARMLQWTLRCEVVGVPALEVIASNALEVDDAPARVAALLNAKRGFVYGAWFERTENDRLRTIEDAAMRPPEPWLRSIPPPFCLLGEGIASNRAACEASGGVLLDESHWAPRARHVVAIGRRLRQAGCALRPEEIVPLYIRRPEAEEVYEKRREAARRRRGE